MTKPFKLSVLIGRITKLENAVAANAWKGSQPPEDHAALEERVRRARLALMEYVIEHMA